MQERAELVSLIVPTFNRPHFLTRLLSYLRKMHFEHPIVVADSSIEPMSKSNQSIIRKAQRKLDVEHIAFKPDTQATPKIAKTLSTVGSKYVAMCADDDFIIPRAIDKCVKFLESNDDFAVAHGKTLFLYSVAIREHGRNIMINPVQSNPSISRLWALDYTQPSNDLSDPAERLLSHLRDYRATFYSVHRRANLKRNFQLASDNTKDLFLGELLPSCLSVIQGKVKHIDTLYSVRPYNERDLTSKGADRLDLPDLMASKEFSLRYTRMRDCLASELARAKSLNTLEASKIIDRILLTYMNQYLQSKFPTGQDDAVSRTSRRVVNVIRMIPAAAKSALMDHQILFMLRKPLDFAITTYATSAKRGYMPVSKIVAPSSGYQIDLLPVLQCL